MPIYEYHCSEHGKFEKIREMTEASKDMDCPKCGKKAKRVLSVFMRSKLNWSQTDGEGFTSRYVSDGELREMNQETRGR